MSNHIQVLKSILSKALVLSSDKEKPVGALVLFKDGHSAFGCNQTEYGEALLDDKSNIIHAEISALSTPIQDRDEGVMYVTKTPCICCARAIVDSGKVVVLVSPKPYEESRWYKEQLEALAFLEENLELILVDFDDREELSKNTLKMFSKALL